MERKDLIAQNIKALREEHCLTQQELADKLHVTRQAVARWENEYTEPDLDTILSIANIFGVSVEYLITAHDKENETSAEKETPVVEEIYIGASAETPKQRHLEQIKTILAVIFLSILAVGMCVTSFICENLLAEIITTALCVFLLIWLVVFILHFVKLRKSSKSENTQNNDETPTVK